MPTDNDNEGPGLGLGDLNDIFNDDPFSNAGAESPTGDHHHHHSINYKLSCRCWSREGGRGRGGGRGKSIAWKRSCLQVPAFSFQIYFPFSLLCLSAFLFLCIFIQLIPFLVKFCYVYRATQNCPIWEIFLLTNHCCAGMGKRCLGSDSKSFNNLSLLDTSLQLLLQGQCQGDDDLLANKCFKVFFGKVFLTLITVQVVLGCSSSLGVRLPGLPQVCPAHQHCQPCARRRRWSRSGARPEQTLSWQQLHHRCAQVGNSLLPSGFRVLHP